MQEKTDKKPVILVVDDVPGNIKTLAASLSQDYEVVFATNGVNALKIANTRELDLILLDIVMPEMDGFEVCKKLKTDEITKDIPVIFVTAKNEETDETHGFELGAIDYITKPISPPIVQARVATYIELSQSRKKILQKNDELVAMAKMKEDVEHIIRHDLKSPINGIVGFSEILLSEDNLDIDSRQSVVLIKDLAYRTLDMIQLSLGMIKMEQGTYDLKPEPVDAIAMILGILTDIKNNIKFKRLNVTFKLNDNLIELQDEKGLIYEDEINSHVCEFSGEKLISYSLFANLIKNAVEASPRKQDLNIDIKAGDEIFVVIHNMGTVPENIRDTFFDKYATSGKATGTGLGTYSAKLIAETQNGSISMQSSDEQGTTITVTLPKAESVNE
ncbi:MAG: hybrid sensor histidine kinase/response regulator, partial [Gammaproteobacteria bacterium]|nr:hybrid sensor histidine kinase/response regulator [Gammaproteobacteria bacterium]